MLKVCSTVMRTLGNDAYWDIFCHSRYAFTGDYGTLVSFSSCLFGSGSGSEEFSFTMFLASVCFLTAGPKTTTRLITGI